MVRRGTTSTTLGLTTEDHASRARNSYVSLEGQLAQAKKRIDLGKCDLASRYVTAVVYHRAQYLAHRESMGRLGRAEREDDRELARQLKASEHAVSVCFATRPPPSLPREVQLVLLDSVMERATTDEERNAALAHAGRIRRYKMR